MFVVTLVFALAVGFAVEVASFPAGDLAFPEEDNGVKESLEGGDRFNQGFRPESQWNRDRYTPVGYQRPDQYFNVPGSRPGTSFRPDAGSGFSGQDSRLPVSRPGTDFRPQGLRPFENSRPQGSFQQSRPAGTNSNDVYNPTSFQPDFLAIGSGGSGSQNQNSGSGSSNFQPEENSGSSNTQDGATPSGGSETTTKIPRRDPTYRIVYTVSCPCSYTRQYEPVCGTDGQTYGNIGILQCAQTCGKDVKVFLNGSCGRNNGHAGTISLKY